MTREEKKRLLAEIEKQYKWLMTKSPTIYMIDIAFDAIRKAVRDEAEQEPKISLEAYKQVARERDIAIEQLHELGYEFGEKIPTIQERQAESDRFDAAFQDGYNNGYAQARFDYAQEPTTKNNLVVDCISRKELDKALYEHFHEEDSPNNITEVRLGAVRNFIKDFPSVTPQEPRWIPVSERLPEDFKTVIASVDRGGVYPEARYSKECGWEWAYESGADYWEELEEVKAWMPLPAPFEPQESEGKE